MHKDTRGSFDTANDKKPSSSPNAINRRSPWLNSNWLWGHLFCIGDYRRRTVRESRSDETRHSSIERTFGQKTASQKRSVWFSRHVVTMNFTTTIVRRRPAYPTVVTYSRIFLAVTSLGLRRLTSTVVPSHRQCCKIHVKTENRITSNPHVRKQLPSETTRKGYKTTIWNEKGKRLPAKSYERRKKVAKDFSWEGERKNRAKEGDGWGVPPTQCALRLGETIFVKALAPYLSLSPELKGQVKVKEFVEKTRTKERNKKTLPWSSRFWTTAWP